MKINELWGKQSFRRLCISIVIAVITVAVLITLMVLFALHTNVAIGYRLLMIAPCVIYLAVVGKLVYNEIMKYKSADNALDSVENNN